MAKTGRQGIVHTFLKERRDLLGYLHGSYAFIGPEHVQIDLTNQCNNNCIACWCNSPLLEEKALPPEKKMQTLPWPIVKELIDELAQLGTREIHYSGGGEPFMHPQIMEILEHTKRKGLVCVVNTNFTLVDRQRVDKIIEIGVNFMSVSTWAATAKTYALTHPNKSEDTFRQIVDNLTFLNTHKHGGPMVKLHNVIFNRNYHELKEMIEFAQATRSESLEFVFIDTVPGKTDTLLLTAPQISQLQQAARAIAQGVDRNSYYEGILLERFDCFLRRVSSPVDVASATYDRNVIDKIPCANGWYSTRILADGNVNACLKAHRIPVGNLYESNFKRIWNDKKQHNFRKKTRVYKKSDPFFRLIGNDPDTKEAGCYKGCDDMLRNVRCQERIRALKPAEYALGKVLAHLCRAGCLLSPRPAAGRQNPRFRGIHKAGILFFVLMFTSIYVVYFWLLRRLRGESVLGGE